MRPGPRPQEGFSLVLKRQLGCGGRGSEVGVSPCVEAAFVAPAARAGAFPSLLAPAFIFFFYNYQSSYFNEEMT